MPRPLEAPDRPGFDPLVFVQTITARNTWTVPMNMANRVAQPHGIRDDTPTSYDLSLRLLKRRYLELERHFGRPPDAAAFALACPVDWANDTIHTAAELGELGWIDRSPAADFANALGMDPGLVVVRNIVESAAMAQLDANNTDIGWRQPGVAEAICRFGSGVNGALLVPPSATDDGFTLAREYGHLPFGGNRPCSCGERGHWEAYASTGGVRRSYGSHFGDDFSETDFSRIDWHNMHANIAEGIGKLVFGGEPTRVSRLHVFGGIVLNDTIAVDTALDIVRRDLRADFGLEDDQIVPAYYRNLSPSIGAYLMALDELAA